MADPSGNNSISTLNNVPIFGGTVGNALYHGIGNIPAEGPVGMVLLGFADNINGNVAGDTQIAINLPPGMSNYGFTSAANVSMRAWGQSGSFSTVGIGLFTQANKGGTTLLALTGMNTIVATGSGTFGSLLGFAPATTSIVLNNTALFLNVATTQGGTCTFNFYIYGFPFP